MEEKNYRYDAFISYRHGELDDFVAAKLHRKLETYVLPSDIARQTGRKRLNRIFRDREELMSSSNLTKQLEEALYDSKYLILICSSRTIKSPWVMKEVTTFKALNGLERILVLIIEGEIEEVIPDVLRVSEKTYEENGKLVTYKEKVEPLATDIRGANQREIGKKLNEELLRLVAPIVGCLYDDLKQRHKERHKKKWIGLAFCLILLVLGFGSFNAWRVHQIKEQMQEKLATQSRALADQSFRLLEKGDRMRAILVGKEALPKSLEAPEKPIMDEALYALSEALYVYKFNFKLVPEKTLDYLRPLSLLKVSPKGRWTATLSEEGYIELWNLETGELKDIIKEENNSMTMNHFEFIDDQSYMISDEKGLRLVKIETGEVSWQINDESYTAFYLSPDYSQILVIGEQLKLYDRYKQEEIGALVGKDIHTYGLLQVAWNSDKSLIALGQDGKVMFWDVPHKKWGPDFESEYKDIAGLVFTSPTTIAIASNDEYKDQLEYFYGNGRGRLNYAQIGIDTIEAMWQIDFNESSIALLKSNPESPEQLIMVKNNVLETVDATVGKVQYSLPQSATILNYCLLGENLALCGMRDGSVRTLMLDVGGVYESASFNHPSNIQDFNYGGGRIVITTGQDKKAYIYKNIEGSPKATFEGFEGTMDQGGYSEDDRWLFTLSIGEETGYIWDMQQQTLEATIPIREDIEQFGFLHDGQGLYTFNAGDELQIWNRDGNFKKSFKNKEATKIAYASPYFYLMTPSELMMLDENTLKVSKKVENLSPQSLTIINEGQVLIIDEESSLYEVDLNTNKRRVLKEQGVLECIATRETIAVYLEDKSVEVIDLETGEKQDTIANDGIELSYLTFDEEGHELWLGYKDTTVWCYTLETQELEQLKEDLPSPMATFQFAQGEKRGAMITDQQEAIIYNMKNQKKLGHLKHIIAINNRCDEFIGADYKSLYVISFYTAEMLLEEADKQLAGKVLSDQEKEQYFIKE